jgi:AraC-like DNA-binding protein
MLEQAIKTPIALPCRMTPRRGQHEKRGKVALVDRAKNNEPGPLFPPNLSHIVILIPLFTKREIIYANRVDVAKNGETVCMVPVSTIRRHAAGRGLLEPAALAIKKQPSATYTVSSLAALVGMSRSAFARAFRANFGQSPMEFLASVRLDQAVHLLRTTNLPIKAVGMKVGYKSRGSFSHAFQRVFGVSPGRFRASAVPSSEIDIRVVATRLRLLSGVMQEVSWEVNLGSGEVWWSDETFSELGYQRRKRLISDVSRFHKRIHPRERQRVVEGMEAACETGELTWRDCFRFRKADGSYAQIENACIILRNAVGAPTRLIGVMQKSEDRAD